MLADYQNKISTLKMKNIVVLILLIVASCSPPRPKEEKNEEVIDQQNVNSDYILNFKKVDNLAKVYIGDSLVFTSQIVHGNPEVDYNFDFSSFVKDGSEILKVQLYNGEEPYHQQEDQHWEIRYYIIIEGEVVEFEHEFGDDYTIGIVFEKEYELTKWTNL